MTSNLPESGELLTQDCSRCGAEHVEGIEFIRGGVRVWKCGQCGRGMNNGYSEEVHKTQLETKLGRDKATENRDRFWRENQQKQMEEFKRLQREPGADPEKVWSIDYATKKWRFERLSHTP